jgi:type II secretory pathway component PulJ
MMAATPIEDRERWRAAEGFTLMGVMIAIGIMATILVILYGAYSAALVAANTCRHV